MWTGTRTTLLYLGLDQTFIMTAWISFCSCCLHGGFAWRGSPHLSFLSLFRYTERFHFYHRYRIRGIRHVIFYAPPSTAHFYPEMLNLLQEASDQSEAVSCVVRACTGCDVVRVAFTIHATRHRCCTTSTIPSTWRGWLARIALLG